VATLVPALLQVSGELAHLRKDAMRRLPFGNLPCHSYRHMVFHPMPRGPADGRLRLARLEQGEDFLAAC
jgi:hypothetical protein